MDSGSSKGSDRGASTAVKVVVIFGALLLAGAVAWIVGLHRDLATLKTESSRAIEAHLNTIQLQSQQVAALDALAVRVESFNREFGALSGNIKVGEGLDNNIEQVAKRDIPERAKQALAELEKNIAEIQQMAAKVREYERYLGTPVLVKRGDSHSAIARDYLVKEMGLPAKEADAVLKRTALAWELEPGNQVFSLYKDGLFLSTVTQGSAKRSPLMAQFSSRQAAADKIRALEERVRQLEAKQSAPVAAEPAVP